MDERQKRREKSPFSKISGNMRTGSEYIILLRILEISISVFFFSFFISRLKADPLGLQKAAEFCPHHVGHYLGMDTHDTHMVSRGLGLHPGMVITVEPGIYISEDNQKVPERFVTVRM